MNRRHFIKQTAAIAPLILGFDNIASAEGGFLEKLISEENYHDRILVLIELSGGNDSLNTVIPLDKYKILTQARPHIVIPENKVIKLADSNVFAFHPAMSALHRLYTDKLVTIIQGVGYPDTDFSHFRGIDIKYTAMTQRESRSGWVGRYLEQRYPHFPAGYPIHPTDGPPAIRNMLISPKMTAGTDEDLSIGIVHNSDFNSLLSLPDDDPVSNDMGGANINTIRAISNQIKLFAPTIQAFAKKQQTLSKLYPQEGENSLADQLKMVAKLIGSGLNTQIYVVKQSGYDTHGEQVEPSDPTLGKHASLLKELSEAIAAFEDDIHLMGRQDQVLGMTFSEFGRRIASSDSYGTDHGAAEAVILFGTKLKNSMVGSSPDMPDKVTENDNLLVQFDFRSLYKNVLRDWLSVSEDRIRTIIPQGPDERLALFKV